MSIGNVTQLVECFVAYMSPWAQCSALYKLGMMTSPVVGKWRQDNQKFKVHREFEVSLGYTTPCLKDKKERKKEKMLAT